MGSNPIPRAVAMKKQTPKNGHNFIALLVGSDQRIQETMTGRLAERGVLVVDRWTAAKNLDRRPLPTGIEIVVIFRDSAISRHVRDRIGYNAKQAGALVIDAQTFALVDETLDAKGYKARPIEAPSAQTPKETPVLAETDQQKLERLGAEMRRQREAKGLSCGAVGAKIGCSDSLISSVERGIGKPSSQVCDALEKYYGFPAGSFPRLAKRQNHRIATPHLPPAPPPPVELEPPPESPPAPAATPARAPIDTGIDGQDTNPDHVRIHLEVLAIQARMRRLGISRIELTPTTLSVVHHEQQGAP